jgi:hypothetical protein
LIAADNLLQVTICILIFHLGATLMPKLGFWVTVVSKSAEVRRKWQSDEGCHAEQFSTLGSLMNQAKRRAEIRQFSKAIGYIWRRKLSELDNE